MTSPGWAEALGRKLAGDDDVWQRTRARGGKPFSICADDRLAKGQRGGHKGAAGKRLNNTLKALAAKDEADE